MSRREAVAVTVAAALALATPGQTSARPLRLPGAEQSLPADTIAPRTAALDTLTALWSNDGFNSIIDGQPGPPGSVKLAGDLGWLNLTVGPRPLIIGVIPSYTPPWTTFFRNSQFSLLIPLRWGGRGPRFGNLGIAWQQRWVASIRHKSTFATYLEADFPTGAATPVTGLTIAGAAASVFGSGVGFLNAAILLDGGSGLGAWSFLGAYKLPVSAGAYLSGDYVFIKARDHRSTNLLELAAVFSAGSNLAISPGGVIGLGHREITPSWGAGVRLTYLF
jgi:hypothetical protein